MDARSIAMPYAAACCGFCELRDAESSLEAHIRAEASILLVATRYDVNFIDRVLCRFLRHCDEQEAAQFEGRAIGDCLVS
jgi:hypothetical protein